MTTYPNLPQRRPVASRLFAVVSLLLALCLVPVLLAQENPGKKAYDIPADDAERALKTFAHQSGLEVLFVTDATQGVRTLAVKGEYTPREALDQLLAGTPLTATQSGPTGAFKVRREKSVELAEKNVASRASRDRAADLDEKREDVVKLDTFEVFGRKTLNMDIPRTRDDVQPYVVFDLATIQLSGATSTEEFIRSRLPMNTTQSSNSQVPGNILGGNASTINLRGLGVNQTVVLVDGRRLPNVNVSSINGNQPDINGVPLASVERIEVLPATASGIYGGGATGGVVNIITRKNYAGAEISGTYGNTFRDDYATRRIDGTAGLNLNGGRTNISLSVSYSDADVLTAGERDFLQRSRALQVANNSSAFTVPPQSQLVNIRSVNGSNLILDSGILLNSPITFVPSGYAGRSVDNGAALVVNAGRYNYDIPNEALQGSMITAPKIAAASFTVRQEVSQSIEVYADVAWNRNRSRNASLNGFTRVLANLPADAPNNPFSTAVRVTFPVVWPAIMSEQQSESVRAASGVIIKLPKDWQAVLDYSWSRTRFEGEGNSPSIGDPDGTGPGISSDIAFANGTLDVIRDVNVFPLNFTPYLLSQPSQHIGPSDSILSDASTRVSGAAWELQGGPLTISALVEHRKEVAKAYYLDTTGFTSTYTPERKATVDSFYLESGVPVFSTKNARPFLQELSVQASLRYDGYTTVSPSPTSVSVTSHSAPLPAFVYFKNKTNATKYTVGAKHSPFKGIALRASYNTGFLPPSISQIVPGVPRPPTSLPLFDPKRGGTTYIATIPFIFGGNPNLHPEESQSFSSGIIFTPAFVPGLRFSIDYTEIEKHNEILSLNFTGPNNVLLFEDGLPGRVSRAALTPADSALGYTGGLVTSLDLSSANISRTQLRAVDIALDYDWRHGSNGKVHLYALATCQMELSRQTAVGQPVVNSVGYNNGVVKWRGNAGINWDGARWSAGWNTQYFGSYLVYQSGSAPTAIATAVLNQGADRIPSQMYHDVFVRYRMTGTPSGWRRVLAGAEITFGIQNIFDKSPPILAMIGTSPQLAYSTYGDARLSRYQLTVRKKF